MLVEKYIAGFCLIFSLFNTLVNGECANACSGHGKCTSYDMCICHKDWRGNDCSERICQFGRAHVDTPLGDLNADGVLSKTKVVVNDIVYPYGIAEAFPLMQDTALRQIEETAHEYMECSNKGSCDRTSGDCVCFDGYEGSACQRTICPNSCSGHGVCMTKAELAIADYGNEYTLWDKNIALGCKCDAGYQGTDCSQRVCKYNVDPLYLDDSVTVKYSEFNFATLTNSNNTDFNDNFGGKGHWAIRFFDHHGEDWLTDGIPAGATCDQVVDALEKLPNNVIPKNSLLCFRSDKTNTPGYEWISNNTKWSSFDINNKRSYYVNYDLSIWDAYLPVGEGDLSLLSAKNIMPGSVDKQALDFMTFSGYIYKIMFTGNPGKIKQPEIEIYLDGTQPSLVSVEKTNSKVFTKVWTDGKQGEDNDYFADICNDVFVTVLRNSSGTVYLGLKTVEAKNKLKSCLGDSDFDAKNNKEVYNWDYGSESYPHFIKLVRAVSNSITGSDYVALYYDATSTINDGTGTNGVFILVNPMHTPDYFTKDLFEVYTTKGTLALTTKSSNTAVSFGSQYFYAKNYSYELGKTKNDGDVSCETSTIAGKNGSYCLNKDDLFTFLNWGEPRLNPPFLNLYTAKNLFTLEFSHYNRSGTRAGGGQHFMTHVIKADLSSNWGITNVEQSMYAVNKNLTDFQEFNQAPYRIYKFFPHIDSTYNYVNECSNRGLCARDTGLCTCFSGYTSDDCSVQDVYSV